MTSGPHLPCNIVRLCQVVSSLLAGAAIGSLSGSTLADSLGRRNAFLANAAPLLAGALLSATATSLAPMVAGRAIAGFGIGLASALVPLYISEVRTAFLVQAFQLYGPQSQLAGKQHASAGTGQQSCTVCHNLFSTLVLSKLNCWI